jgi:aryl-alcohol dehydrogenase-like predicted oxidoreductase
MDPIPPRTLGRTGISLTELGFGAGPLGGFYGPVTPDEAIGAVRAAWDLGIRYFDVAPLYGHGRAEVLLGHVLREVPRDEFVLSTKVGRWRRSGRAACRSTRCSTTRATAQCARSSIRCCASACRAWTS